MGVSGNSGGDSDWKALLKDAKAKVDWQQMGAGRTIIGVDEAGRGCLAGAVCAGAVVLNEQYDFSHYTDSKKVSEVRREELFEEISERHHVGVGIASVQEIEELNILNASLLAMSRAVQNLKVNLNEPLVFVDGNQLIKNLPLQYEQRTVVKGDLRVKPIAAASIIAKVTRDRQLRQMAGMYPEYGFEQHKGYGTKAHRDIIKKLGPCPEHRPSFAGVREYVGAQL